MKHLMIKRIFKSYQKLFSSLTKIFILLLCCFCICLALVFPLWKWAQYSPKSYTILLLSFIAILLLFVLIKSIKRRGIKVWLFRLTKILIITIGFLGIISSVFNGKRVLALLCLLALFFLYGIILIGTKKNEK